MVQHRMRKATIELGGKSYILHLGFEEWAMLEDILNIESFLMIYDKMAKGKLSMKDTLSILLIALKKDYPELDNENLNKQLTESGYSSKQIMEKVILAIGEEMQSGKKEKVTEKKNKFFTGIKRLL